MSQQKYVSHIGELNANLDYARLEDFSVINEDRSLTVVAHEMLVRASWIRD